MMLQLNVVGCGGFAGGRRMTGWLVEGGLVVQGKGRAEGGWMDWLVGSVVGC